MKARQIPLIVFIALIALLAVGLTLNPRDVPSPLIGKPVPSFKLVQIDQSGTFSPESMQGQWWLLNVWASWCEACKHEHKHLLKLADANQLSLIGLNYKDEKPLAKDWLGKWQNPYQNIAFDPTGKVGLDLGVYGVPESFLIDPDGIIQYRYTGPLTAELIKEEIIARVKEEQK